MHVIDQAIDVITEVLKDNVNASVFADTDEPIESVALPAIRVTYLNDGDTDDAMLGAVCRDVEIELQLTNTAPDKRAARTKLMALRVEVETLFAQCQLNLGSNSVSLVLGDAENDQTVEGDRPIAQQTLNYIFTIYYKHGDPESFA